MLKRVLHNVPFSQGGLGAKVQCGRFSQKVCNSTAWIPGSQLLREAAKEKHQTNRKTDN